MIEFMVMVLGSVIFWVIYIPICFFIAVNICHNSDRKDDSYSVIFNILIRDEEPWSPGGGPKNDDTVDKILASFGFLCIMILWPLWVVFIHKCIFLAS